MSSLSLGAIPNVADFFPEIENDLSKVTWAHAVNSETLLASALSSNSVMMLEADVVKGHLENETNISKLVPIMAHPPDNTSDLTLKMWIDRVIEANQQGQKVGAKLDFKDIDIVITSLEILRNEAEMINFPLWLNADILKGPGGENKTTVDADFFLSFCNEFFPQATLSLGWTTGLEPDVNQQYTNEMIEEMIETLERNNINQPVTFPVRAAFIGNSMDALESLYFDKPDYTFTVWTTATDPISMRDLAEFEKSLGSSAVYFDLPDDRMAELKEYHFEDDDSSATTNFSLNTIVILMVAIIISFLGTLLIR